MRPSTHLPSTPTHLKAEHVRLLARLVMLGGELVWVLAKPVAEVSGWVTLFGELVQLFAKPVGQLGSCTCVRRE